MTYTVEVTVPDTIYRTLVEKAHQSGQSVEVVASEWLGIAVQQQLRDPLEAFIGAIDSQGVDWVDRHDFYLGQAHQVNAEREQ